MLNHSWSQSYYCFVFSILQQHLNLSCIEIQVGALPFKRQYFYSPHPALESNNSFKIYHCVTGFLSLFLYYAAFLTVSWRI